ncbi:MAG TPA: VOC family protein [Candidatus Saccharimonadales bacterium]
MLEGTKLFATVAVSSRETAKEFYEGKLGLKRVEENPRAMVYETGGGNLLVYESPSNAGSSQATVAAWDVANYEELKKVVEAMKGKNVEFLTYDTPGLTWEGEIAAMGEIHIAWFKDLDGNVFSIGTP